MTTFPDLLKKSAADCNRAGKPLGMAVLLAGCVTIAITLVLWGTALRSGIRELSTIIGPDAASRIQEQVMYSGSRSEMQTLMSEVSKELDAKFKDMTPERKAEMIGLSFGRFMTDVAPLFIGFIVFSAILGVWMRGFFLLLAIRKTGDFKALAGEALTWMLPLLGLGLLLGAAFGAIALVPFVLGGLLDNSYVMGIGGFLGVGFVLYLVPRVAFAPVFLIQDKTGIRGGIRKSLLLSEGKWFKIVGNLLGAGAMVWIAVFVCQFFINVLSSIAGPVPAFGLIIGQVMVFITLIGKAYSTVFLVRLKEGLKA